MGVCSALFELGGMCVMDDASGCNSTYNTHDEPRWYDTDSLVFITALTENEALMGEDDKTVADICAAAEELRPCFIALAGTPIPAMCGTDIPALGRVIEKRTGIMTFGIQTDGMHSYLSGCSKAFAALARRAVRDPGGKRIKNGVNILGLTPLDFSVGKPAESVARAVAEHGFNVVSSWAMGSSLDDIALSGEAAVNLVVSETGYEAAKILQSRFGTPYVVGAPFGGFAGRLMSALEEALSDGKSRTAVVPSSDGDTVIIGEWVTSASLSAALDIAAGIKARAVCPLESELAGHGEDRIMEESEVTDALIGAKTVIADPLWRPVVPETARFVPLPHEAFSGRIFRRDIPDLTKEESILHIINEAEK